MRNELSSTASSFHEPLLLLWDSHSVLLSCTSRSQMDLLQNRLLKPWADRKPLCKSRQLCITASIHRDDLSGRRAPHSRDTRPRRQEPRRHGPTYSEQQLDNERTNQQQQGTSSSSHRALIHQSPRMTAAQQLLRIEEEGAYANFVNSMPEAQQGNGSAARLADNRPDSADGVDRERAEHAQRDERAVKELVSGVTRWRRRLDYIITQLTTAETPQRTQAASSRGRQLAPPQERAAADLDPAVRQVLRIGVYELLYHQLSSHALNDHVEVAKALRPWSSGFVNGVLRTAVRHLEAGVLAVPEVAMGTSTSGRELARSLSISASHPTWLVTRWLKRFGKEDTMLLLEHNNRTPVYTVRLNQLRMPSMQQLEQQLKSEGVEVEPSPYLPDDYLRVKSGLQTLLKQGFAAQGKCFVQDESAGLVVQCLDPQPGERVLDCCAAPGGKTLAAAAKMQGKGSIFAVDISASKLRSLRTMTDAAGATHMVEVKEGDLIMMAEWRQQRQQEPNAPPLFDKVLLDAPCSGTGVLGKRADLRWRRRVEDIEELTQLQDQLLDAAASLVRPGGVLVYSTCCIEPEEDQERVKEFLQRHREFEIEPVGLPLGAAQQENVDGVAGHAASGVDSAGAAQQRRLESGEGVAENVGGVVRQLVPAAVVTPEGFMATLPHVHGTDGAFAARLRRKA